MRNITKEDSLHILHQSNGFSTRISRYKGVTPPKCGKREARLGQFLGKKPMMKLPYRSSESCNLQIHLLYFYPINPIWWIQASKAMMDLPVILNFTATQTHKGFNIVRVTPITGYVNT